MKLLELLEEVKNERNFSLVDNINEDFEELNEGVKFFKASKRLERFARTIKKKSTKYPELVKLLPRINQAIKAFRDVEEAYAAGRLTRAKARAKLDSIKKQYAAIMQELKKKEIKDALKVAGVATALAAIVAAIIFGGKFVQTLAVYATPSAANAALSKPSARNLASPSGMTVSKVAAPIKPQVSSQLKQLENVYNRAAFAAAQLGKANKTKIFNRASAAGL